MSVLFFLRDECFDRTETVRVKAKRGMGQHLTADAVNRPDCDKLARVEPIKRRNRDWGGETPASGFRIGADSHNKRISTTRSNKILAHKREPTINPILGRAQSARVIPQWN